MRVIITGTTGMVGFGVLEMCIRSNDVSEILIINRKSVGFSNHKVKEILVNDYSELKNYENDLKNFDACFFCLGISSVGMNLSDYKKITYDLTINFANLLSKNNSNLTFIYVSGMGTDSNEKGNGWAAIKGKTENDLFIMKFKNVYAWRPGFIKPIQGLKNMKSYYKYLNWMFPIGKLILPKGFNTLEEVGQSMINIVKNGYSKKIIDGNDIRLLAK